MDEPSNNLDVEKVELLKKLISTCVYNGITILMVTHDHRLVDQNNFKTIEINL